MTSPPPLDEAHAAAMADLAGRYTAAFVAGDVDAMAACYADGAEVVQIMSDRTADVALSLRIVAWLHRKLPDLRVDGLRTTVTESGFVQEYVIRGTTPDGTEIRSPTCLVVEAGPEGITRLVEYFDQTATAAIG